MTFSGLFIFSMSERVLYFSAAHSVYDLLLSDIGFLTAIDLIPCIIFSWEGFKIQTAGIVIYISPQWQEPAEPLNWSGWQRESCS